MFTKSSDNDFIKKCEVRWNQMPFGVHMWTCWHEECLAPIGFVYGVVLSSNTFYVCNSYVTSDCRRKGVRSLINKHILDWCPVIQTGQGSDDGGAEFLKASGYKYLKESDKWQLVKKGYKPKPSEQNKKILSKTKNKSVGKNKRRKGKSNRNKRKSSGSR